MGVWLQQQTAYWLYHNYGVYNNRLIMFTEFLHPQLVLFGQFSNKVKCKHKYEHKDGEIIVHQLINRASFLTNNLVTQFMHMLNQKKQHPPSNQWDDEPNYNHYDHQEEYYRQQQYYHDQDYEDVQYDDEQQQRRGYEGYFDQDSNPYADEEVYGLTMDAQYMPQQLNGLYSPNNNPRPPSVSLPFQSNKQNKGKQQDEQQQGWITQEQEQYYVNEQLEQAAGNFATDFIPDALQ